MSRRQLYGLGFSRWEVRAELEAQRWVRTGRQTISILAGGSGENGSMWRAVFEVGADAALDGSSALRAAGLEGYDDVIHVSVSKSSRYQRPKLVRVHETRRRHPGDLMPIGLPRVRPEIAAIRAALWARSDRQAALVLTMAVAQRLVTVEQLHLAFAAVRRDKRRRLIRRVLADMRDGVRSLGELDFTALCRRRGLPEPDRQVVRRGPGGRVYLDVCWTRWRVVVEIEGIHHAYEENVVPDSLRQNSLTIDSDKVLRIPLLGLRTAPDEYMDQVEQALIAAGCPLVRRTAA